MNSLLTVLTFCLIFGQIICPPVKEQKKDENNENAENGVPTDADELQDYMEYHRYLKEVVNALESDPEFRKKLEKADEADIRNGKIAHELEFVSHRVRNKLDEIKRAEIERLRHLASMKNEMENRINENHLNDGSLTEHQHLDHANPHTFEIDDLKKLIHKTSQDLAEADKKRREEFKQYEMQKEFEKNEKLKSLDDVHRVEMEKQLSEQEEKHKNHGPLHHPGSKQQLEEVWEKQDHMDSQDFDPKTFFMLHDLDGNGHWDQNEVKALFLKELDKLYQAGTPEDDMRERAEEMERMREHVFNEADMNRDGLISYQEFVEQTKRPDFNQDPGWEGLDQQKVYTQDEYQEFERRRREEIQRLIAQGILPPNPVGYPPDVLGQHPNQFPPQGHHPNNPQYNPNGHQQYPQYAQPQGVHPNVVGQQQGQYHPGQVPPQNVQYHPGQGSPQQQYHPQQQQQQQQYYPGQAPPSQVHPQQMPQFQQHPNQVHLGNNVPQYPNQVPQTGNVPPVNIQTHNQNPPQAAPQQPGHGSDTAQNSVKIEDNEIVHHGDSPLNAQQVNANSGSNQQPHVNTNQNNVPVENKQPEQLNSIKQ